ncbi:filamentous hemagglutinin N-terminal domain-containing protein [Brasilonema sennae]|uniref:filamentous hemagglutinin N-terminal domain-containing protein n=1 Tax=Brasilonema sennae TaxID=1397703 RepID=UPI00155A9302|nr:filamentous hemagglutinin N-terminal domain-containing protein [Brasilonema sennae]
MTSRSWLTQAYQLGLSGLLILVGLLPGKGGDSTLAQVTADPSLGTQVTINGTTLEITEGKTVGNTNLFHSFSNFSVKNAEVASFLNASNIKNILVRVTGGNASDIQGTLQAKGKANLFLINPSGILFGRDAQLRIGGSFIATTANAIQFPGGGEFSMTSPVNPLNPLLTVNPSAFLFNQIPSGSTSSIQVNRAIRLFVPQGQSLLLVGGDVKLDRAILRAESGRIELGGLAGVGTVGLNIDSSNGRNNFRLDFPQGVQRADVSLTNATRVTATGTGGGSIQLSGKRIILSNGSEVSVNNQGSEPGGTLVVNASELVELLERSRLLAETLGSGNAGELRIETGQLILQDGAQVSAITSNKGRGGTLSVNARDSIQVIGISAEERSGLFTSTRASGDAGDIRIETGQLIVRDGGQIAASARMRSQGKGGTIDVRASDKVELSGTAPNDGEPSGLFARSLSSGVAGDISIATGQLIVRDKAQVTVSAVNSGNAGNLQITSPSIRLDNKGAIVAETASGKGGNITLQGLDLLLMRGNSQISTTAGKAGGGGDGGNIIINVPNGFIVARPGENSDITANAFEGSGGRVTINATDIFGIAPLSSQELKRLRPDDSDPTKLQTNDITAISQTNPSLSGTIEINTPDVDLNTGLVTLPSVPVDTKLAQSCNSPNYAQSSFIITGRGGLPPNPKDILTPDAVQVDWVTLNPNSDKSNTPSVSTPTKPTPEPIVEATGWVFNAKGEVVFTADAPTTTPRSSWNKPAKCRT